jgi:hypothetical protein
MSMDDGDRRPYPRSLQSGGTANGRPHIAPIGRPLTDLDIVTALSQLASAFGNSARLDQDQLVAVLPKPCATPCQPCCRRMSES